MHSYQLIVSTLSNRRLFVNLHQRKSKRLKGSRHLFLDIVVMFWLGLSLLIFGAVVVWAAFSVVSMILGVIIDFIREV